MVTYKYWRLRGLKTKSVALGRGCRGAMIPAKMISEPQDLQNYLQAPQNWSPSLSDVTKPPAILSPWFWTTKRTESWCNTKYV